MSFFYLMFAGLSAATAAFCFYLVSLVVNTQQSSGAWLFAAFGLLFKGGDTKRFDRVCT